MNKLKQGTPTQLTKSNIQNLVNEAVIPVGCKQINITFIDSMTDVVLMAEFSTGVESMFVQKVYPKDNEKTSM